MKDFLDYYRDELLFLREKCGVFAKKHPDIASKLDIKNGESSDPQTERIIESVAFMGAQLNQKIDYNSENIAFFLLSALYPNLINSFPPCGIVKFEYNDIMYISDKITIDKNTSLFINSKSNVECQFKTIYPITLYPLTISEVQILKSGKKTGGIDGWSLKITITTDSNPIEDLEIGDLLFYINFDIIEDALALYESIFSNPNRNVFLKINDQYIKIDNSNITPCGFGQEDSITPVPDYSTNSFQLFQELLYFKQKFMFFKILNIGNIIKNSKITNIYDFSIFIDITLENERLPEIINNESILIDAVPAVNLFQVTSDPFKFDGLKTKYLLLPDQSKYKYMEIYSILELHTIDSESQKDQLVQPYFSLAIDSDTNAIHDLYWVWDREFFELDNSKHLNTYVSFIDTQMNPYKSYNDTVYAKTLCSNRFESRDIPIFSQMYIDAVESGGYVAKLLTKITNPIYPFEENSNLWNLIQHLTTTHISLSNINNIVSHLKSLLYIMSNKSDIKIGELFNSIENIQVREITKRFGKDAWRGFVKGIEVIIEVNENYNQINYLLGCVLNQYFSDIISINSFVELKIISSISRKVKAYWSPTSGRQNLI